jgi:hypothetical protein
VVGFIDTSIPIATNYNSSQSMTVYDALHSVLDYKCLFFFFWLGSDLRIGHFFGFSSWTLNCLTTDSFFSARLLTWSTGNYGKCLLPVCCQGNAPCTELVCSDLLSQQSVLISRLFVAAVTCSHNRCPAMVIFVTIFLFFLELFMYS